MWRKLEMLVMMRVKDRIKEINESLLPYNKNLFVRAEAKIR